MKTFFKIVICLFVAIVIVILALAAYIWFANPYGVRSVLQKQIAPQTVQIDESYDHPMLDDSQEKQLRDIGIDPAELPEEVTDEQIDCAVEVLGEQRAAELEKTQDPRPDEILRLMKCL